MEFNAFRLIVFIIALIALFIVALLLKKNWRKWSYIAILALLIAYAAVEITAPMIRAHNYESFLIKVENKLNEQYPNQKWTMNKDINLYSFPYDFAVEVIFENDPNVSYQYTLEDGKLHEYARMELE
ncbi:hypothetical protein [Ureibacillus chungkukjangi]|uniref:DUF3139 domain-containing protein n=1 Tax=Ureibacillus chungkukjangi TaxID=1202712 RepID=A0A318TUP0_9BACL|nr:hypothetical protein [Ureibacillus chungkukjangi]PYF08384.1 hypothetical protein BJ095_102150 [Ureibacillus chungkukjangi]